MTLNEKMEGHLRFLGLLSSKSLKQYGSNRSYCGPATQDDKGCKYLEMIDPLVLLVAPLRLEVSAPSVCFEFLLSFLSQRNKTWYNLKLPVQPPKNTSWKRSLNWIIIASCLLVSCGYFNLHP